MELGVEPQFASPFSVAFQFEPFRLKYGHLTHLNRAADECAAKRVPRRTSLPNDDAAPKLLYLAIKNAGLRPVVVAPCKCRRSRTRTSSVETRWSSFDPLVRARIRHPGALPHLGCLEPEIPWRKRAELRHCTTNLTGKAAREGHRCGG